MAFSIDDLVDQAKAPPPPVQPTLDQKQANVLAAPPSTNHSVVSDVSNALADSATQGGTNWLINKMQGGDDASLQKLRADTEQARKNIGMPANIAASVAGYVGGPGKIFGPLSKAVAGGGIIGGSLEGALGGGTSAAGHGGGPLDTAEGAMTGGVLGGATSAISTALGPTVRKAYEWMGGGSPAKVTQAATDAADAQWKTFDNFKYDPTDLTGALSAVRKSVYPTGTAQSYLDATPQTGKILDDYASTLAQSTKSGVQETATGYTDTMKKLGQVIQGGGPDAAAAKAAKDAMTNRLAFVNPTNGSGVDVAKNLAEANRLHGLQKNAETLENMQNSLTYGKSGGPAQTAQDMLKNQPDFYNPQQTTALQGIAKSAPSTNAASDLAPFAIPVGGYFAGGGPGAIAGAGIGAATRLFSPMSRNAAVRQQITDAYPALTGQSLANPEQKTSDLLRQLTGGYLSEDKRTRASLPSDLGVGGYVQPYLGY